LTTAVKRSFWCDWPFWWVLSLGPICWYLLYRFELPLNEGPVSWEKLFWIALAYPVLEEFVFRGGVQAELYGRWLFSRSFLGISLANVITSVLFAAMHLINQPPLWAALVFLPSLIFGWSRDRYGNIRAAIALHVTYNAGFITVFETGP